jgi:hypothetical protein
LEKQNPYEEATKYYHKAYQIMQTALEVYDAAARQTLNGLARLSRLQGSATDAGEESQKVEYQVLQADSLGHEQRRHQYARWKRLHRALPIDISNWMFSDTALSEISSLVKTKLELETSLSHLQVSTKATAALVDFAIVAYSPPFSWIIGCSVQAEPD